MKEGQETQPLFLKRWDDPAKSCFATGVGEKQRCLLADTEGEKAFLQLFIFMVWLIKSFGCKMEHKSNLKVLAYKP